MDKRDDQELFIPPAGSYMNPVNQPPPTIPPPSYDSISTPTAPYPIDSNTNGSASQQNDKNVQNSGIDDSTANENCENGETQDDSSEDEEVSCKNWLCCVFLKLIFVGIILSFIYRPWNYLRAAFETDNYFNEEGDYIVRTKYQDFIKLVDGKNSRPNSGLLIIRRMDKTEYVRGYWNSDWTPICAFNFKEQQQACEDLGFSGFLGYTETHYDSINGGKWQISDGWREDYAYGKYPNTELGSMLINDRPKSILNYEMREPYYGGPCGATAETPVVWLECDPKNKKSPKKLSEIGFDPPG